MTTPLPEPGEILKGVAEGVLLRGMSRVLYYDLETQLVVLIAVRCYEDRAQLNEMPARLKEMQDISEHVEPLLISRENIKSRRTRDYVKGPYIVPLKNFQEAISLATIYVEKNADFTHSIPDILLIESACTPKSKDQIQKSIQIRNRRLAAIKDIITKSDDWGNVTYLSAKEIITDSHATERILQTAAKLNKKKNISTAFGTCIWPADALQTVF